MMQQNRIQPVLTLAAALMALLTAPAIAAEVPDLLPDPDGKPADQSKPCTATWTLWAPPEVCGGEPLRDH